MLSAIHGGIQLFVFYAMLMASIMIGGFVYRCVWQDNPPREFVHLFLGHPQGCPDQRL